MAGRDAIVRRTPGASRRPLLLVAVALLALPDRTLAREGDLEAAVKANYLYKFTPFVTWPAGAFSSGASPFNLCVLGGDPFGDSLDAAVRNQRVAGHPVAVRRLARPDEAQTCHLLYLSAGRGRSAVSQSVARKPVLTVTEDDAGAPPGIIRFVPFQGRVRFAIDAAAAQAAGLTISSKLLALAVVLPEGRP